MYITIQIKKWKFNEIYQLIKICNNKEGEGLGELKEVFTQVFVKEKYLNNYRKIVNIKYKQVI